ncbi:MAG: type I glyceraldehyde-3-phosphate dehydrogenase [Hyphomicrobiales bacterium]|nr:type I glyceraldehyde-3-phosphate dehydrogenase [Hyphomicrobiales bacterium]
MRKNTSGTTPTRVAINGFGRIGRMVVRAIVESGRKDIEVVAINDLAQPQQAAHLLRYDSAHGAFPHPVSLSGDALSVGTACKKAKLFSERDPSKLPWKKLKVDVVLECTGRFTARDKAAAHLDAGAGRVLVSAPATNADLTVVYGVNHKLLRKNHRVVSNASCTTNCLAPVAQLMHQLCGIEEGHMTTIHAYTGDQALVDMPHSDPRRARAAASSMIPTTTGAARAVSLVLPELKGRLDGAAVRVPVLNVSVVDLTFRSAKNVDVATINRAMKRAASSKKWEGILGVVEEPLVSVDFNHNSHSSVFDTSQTQMLGKRLVRVVSWYDNEWGFANRMADVAVCLGALG